MGKSWMNTVAGILIIVADVGALIAKYFEENATPMTVQQWITFAMFLGAGIVGIVSKQWNVTNSQQPAAPATVPPSIMATPNPVASLVPGIMVAGPVADKKP